MSSTLCQIQTGKIGLKAFLHHQRVPGANSPLCSCGEAPQTAFHVINKCQLHDIRRAYLRRQLAPSPLLTRRDLHNILKDTDKAKAVAKWLLNTGILSYYSLAESIELERRIAAANPLLGS